MDTANSSPDFNSEGSIQYHHYSVTLTAKNHKDLFSRYPVLSESVNQAWNAVFNHNSILKSDLFHVTPLRLEAIVSVPHNFQRNSLAKEEGFLTDLALQTDGVPELVIEKAIDFFRSLCMHAWLCILHEHDIRSNINFWEVEFIVHQL